MSWQEAKSAAAAWSESAGFSGDLSGKVVLLPDFESEKECRFFIPERSWGFHKMMLKSAGRTIRVNGGRVVLQVLSPKRYRELLSERPDSPEERVAYVARNTRLLNE